VARGAETRYYPMRARVSDRSEETRAGPVRFCTVPFVG
jgi:hypothetical protein